MGLISRFCKHGHFAEPHICDNNVGPHKAQHNIFFSCMVHLPEYTCIIQISSNRNTCDYKLTIHLDFTEFEQQ